MHYLGEVENTCNTLWQIYSGQHCHPAWYKRNCSTLHYLSLCLALHKHAHWLQSAVTGCYVPALTLLPIGQSDSCMSYFSSSNGL